MKNSSLTLVTSAILLAFSLPSSAEELTILAHKGNVTEEILGGDTVSRIFANGYSATVTGSNIQIHNSNSSFIPVNATQTFGVDTTSSILIGNESTETVDISGVAPAAVSSQSGSHVDIVGKRINVEGTQNGINVETSSTLSLGTDLTEQVNISGAVEALMVNRSNALINGKRINISSVNEVPNSASIGIHGKSGTVLTVGSANTESIVIHSTGGSNLTTGEYSTGILADNDGQDTKRPTVNLIAKNIEINSSYFGIHAQNGTQETTIAPEDTSSVNIDADNISITATEAGLAAFSNGRIDINGNITIDAAHVIDTRGNSTINLNADGTHSTVLNGDIVFETPYTKEDSYGSGNLINSYVTIGLNGEDSSWTGRAYQTFKDENSDAVDSVDLDNGYADFGNVTGFNLMISDGAIWNMTGDSFVNTIEVTDNGVVYMTEDANQLNIASLDIKNAEINMQGDEKQSVSISDMAANNATLNMKATTDGKSITTGSFIVENEAAKGSSINVNLTGITSDQITDAQAAFESIEHNVQTVGATQVRTIAEGDINGVMTQEVSAAGEAGAVQKAENTKLLSFRGVNAASLVAWRDEVAYTNQRMEYLRDNSHAFGAWAQVYGGESSYDDATVDLTTTTVQVGADATIGDWIAGAAFSYSKGDADMANGSADTDSYTLSLYTARNFDSGFYVNGLARYGRLSTDATAGNMTASYDNNAFSIGGNVGYRFNFAQQAFVEPNFGLQYAYVMGDDYTATNGVKVEQDDFDALIASLGARVGFNFAEDAGKIYARASVNHDFLGEVDGTASKAGLADSMYVDLGGTWVTYGIGTQFNFTENLSVWGNLDRTTGGEVSTHYMMNAGLRYVF